MFIYKWDSVYIIYVERCLCFAPLLDKQASAKKARKKFDGVSSRQGGKPMESDTILYYYSISFIYARGTFQPTKRDFRSENSIAVLPAA